jgi:hypothetical protein
MDSEALKKLRLVINENLRIQRSGAETVPYIDVSNALSDISARQNHAVFGRRGCGKTLLLHYSASQLPPDIRSVYLNCEDFKKHSFPNVLVEILDALFKELEQQLTGWFGKKRRSRDLIKEIRRELHNLRGAADRQSTEIREAEAREVRDSQKAGLGLKNNGASIEMGADLDELSKVETERKYLLEQDKIKTSTLGCRG